MKLFRHRITQNVIGLGILLGALFCIFPPEILIFRHWAAYGGQIMVGYVALGLLFLVIRQDKLTFVSFFSAALLALFIKISSNPVIRLDEVSGSPSIEVAQLDLDGLSEPYEQLSILENQPADLLILQSLDPLSVRLLRDSLLDEFPYQFGTNHLDQALWVFSRWPMGVYHINDEPEQPEVAGLMYIPELKDTLEFIATYMYPVFTRADIKGYQSHLQFNNDIIEDRQHPILVIGQFNEVSWAPDIRHFREKSGLQDSRRGFLPGLQDLWDKPTHHVFFSEELSCTGFHNKVDSTGRFLGISGTYQWK